MGDVHGHRDVLVGLLRDAGLVEAGEAWIGADARLWLLGDLADRGPDGIDTIDLVRHLEHESGGAVRCLLGNHEALILAAHRFGREPDPGGASFHDVWKLNGGVDADIAGLTPDRVAWLTALPPIGREGDWLVLHADTTAYLALGGSGEEVAGDASSVDELLGILSDRMRLDDPDGVDALLGAYGGSRIVHGHTPIASALQANPTTVTEPLVSRDGRVLNVDHCLFAGGPGFVVRLDEEGEPGRVA